jgi:hypothetical protein
MKPAAFRYRAVLMQLALQRRSSVSKLGTGPGLNQAAKASPALENGPLGTRGHPSRNSVTPSVSTCFICPQARSFPSPSA